MLRLGVRSYLPKDADQEQLCRAIEAVLLVGHYYTPRISRALVRGLPPQARSTARPATAVHFTPREREVLDLICAGRTAAEIAEQLFLSRRTVEGHRQRRLEKTNAPNSAGLAMYAARNGLLDAR